MAEQNEAKTKTIGYLPIDKVQTLKGWAEYVDKSTKLSVLRAEAQQAKNCVRDALKERLNEQGDIDFVGEGDRVRVFRVFRRPQSRRTRTLDLSAAFREQPSLDGTAEAKGDDAGVSEQAEAATPEASPVGETAPATLDPVTERLMAIMQEKRQRPQA
jgi:hypothetical protein